MRAGSLNIDFPISEGLEESLERLKARKLGQQHKTEVRAARPWGIMGALQLNGSCSSVWLMLQV